MRKSILCSVTALFVVASAAFPSVLAAQEPAPDPAPAKQSASSDDGGLRIVILEGEGSVNNVKQRSAREPVIQVVDQNNRPVAGAVVTFTLPSRGASGVFANGARSMTLMSNVEGTATATGLAPNSVAGPMSIQVSASYQGQAASTTIAQTNAAVAGGAGISGATAGILGAVAAGAAVAAAMILRNPDDPPARRRSGRATINAGGVQVGPPR